MDITAHEFGPRYDWVNQDSEINVVTYDLGKLRILVDGPKHVDFRIEVFFDYAHAHIVLDEGDLIAFWESGYSGKDCVALRVFNGGLMDQMPPGIFSVSSGSFSEKNAEWLIMSSHTCVYVLSMDEPEISEVPKSNISAVRAV